MIAVSAFATTIATAQQPALVRVDAVIAETMAQATPVIGRTVARQNGVVAARINGPVGEVFVDVGNRIEAGEPLVRIDTSRLAAEVALNEADLRESQASVEAARAGLELAEQELARMTGLQGSAAFSQSRYEDSLQEARRSQWLLSVAQARAGRAEVSLERARLDLSDAEIPAPFPGVVSERYVDVGEYLQVGDPVVTMVNDTDLEIEAAVPHDRVSGLEPGDAVEVHIGTNSLASSDTVVEAIVRAIIPLEDSLSRTRRVRFTPRFDPAERAMAANQSVIVMVPVGGRRQSVTVHKDAVLTSQDGRTVYVVSDGIAVLRPIIIGEAVGGRFEVIEGLESGELVVVRGNERLRPGQDVQIDGES